MIDGQRTRTDRLGTPSTSATQTTTTHDNIVQAGTTGASGNVESISPGTLRLRGETLEDRKVRWEEGVIDNEGLGKKKSKICCIYHKPKEFGESSSDDSSSQSSSDENDSDDESAIQAKHTEHGCNHKHGHGKHLKATKPRKNAYEQLPK